MRRPASIRAASDPPCPPHPQGGPQPAFCDLEEHNALTAHQERQRLAAARPPSTRRRSSGERGVPRGLPARPPDRQDGAQPDHRGRRQRGRYAQLVADELGVPALDVKVVPADTDRFGIGHGFNTSPSAGAPAAIAQRHREDPGQGAAARRHGARAPRRDAHAGRTAPGSPATAATRRRSKTIEDIALYAHGTGELPPGVEGGLDAQAVYTD